MGEMPEEWKNNLVISVYKEGDKQKLENYRGISLLNECYILHNNILNEKLKKKHSEKFLLEFQNGFR